MKEKTFKRKLYTIINKDLKMKENIREKLLKEVIEKYFKSKEQQKIKKEKQEIIEKYPNTCPNCYHLKSCHDKKGCHATDTQGYPCNCGHTPGYFRPGKDKVEIGEDGHIYIIDVSGNKIKHSKNSDFKQKKEVK